jgi:hypothetical protein
MFFLMHLQLFYTFLLAFRKFLDPHEHFIVKVGSDFLIIKPTRCTNFSNLFWNKTLHDSHSSSVHHQEFFTVHTALVYVTQVC